MLDRITKWLETKWVTPAYAGWLLMALTICFFGAATNTMAGWLYVLSGVGVALLSVAAILPARSLKSLTINRIPISPVTAGAELEITLAIVNPTNRSPALFQVQDLAPFSPFKPPTTAIETILPQSEYRWVYRQPTEKRGVYQWERIVLRSGAPIGLFWCQRDRQAAATAYVYPQVLKLSQCPLIDGIGSSDRPTNRQFSSRHLEMATEGITRSLRPYRYGDSFRSIHWRTSARYGEFQVRELEIDRGGQDVVICLDSGANWQENDFEQAVIAACSLYFYAHQFAHLHVKLWTAGSGLISGDRQVLETLAAVQMDEPNPQEIPQTSLVYLTSQSQQLETLPPGSSWVLWNRDGFNPTTQFPGIVINPHQSLQKQLSNPSGAGDRYPTTDARSLLNHQNSDLN
jgi:uncharacterized protein (DUF58 family)